jgi:hypothetical protein
MLVIYVLTFIKDLALFIWVFWFWFYVYVEITPSCNTFIPSISICCVTLQGTAVPRITRMCSDMLKWIQGNIYFSLYNDKEIWISSLYDTLQI